MKSSQTVTISRYYRLLRPMLPRARIIILVQETGTVSEHMLQLQYVYILCESTVTWNNWFCRWFGLFLFFYYLFRIDVAKNTLSAYSMLATAAGDFGFLDVYVWTCQFAIFPGLHYASLHIQMFKSPHEIRGQAMSNFLLEGMNEGKQRSLGILSGGFVILHRGLLGNTLADIPYFVKKSFIYPSYIWRLLDIGGCFTRWWLCLCFIPMVIWLGRYEQCKFNRDKKLTSHEFDPDPQLQNALGSFSQRVQHSQMDNGYKHMASIHSQTNNQTPENTNHKSLTSRTTWSKSWNMLYK